MTFASINWLHQGSQLDRRKTQKDWEEIMKDKLSSTDYVEAGLAGHADAVYPCPACRKEMKDNNQREDRVAERNMRICSSESCRVKAEWTSGSAVVLDN